MKKFAFLVHLRDYRRDLGEVITPLGWLPESFYRFALNSRPLPPILWGEVSVTPNATEAEGYLIILPYSGQQMLEQRRQMIPLVNQAIRYAAGKGAEILGLGALTSPVTLGGRLVAANGHLSITNGNAYTAVILHQQVVRAMKRFVSPVVAIVGASGSVGSLVCKLLAKDEADATYLLIARNARQTRDVAGEMKMLNRYLSVSTSTELSDLCKADIILLVTSAPGTCLMPAS